MLEICTLKNVEKKIELLFLQLFLQEYYLVVFEIINIDFSIFIKIFAKAYFHLSRSCHHFNYNHFMKKQLLFNRHFRNSVAGIRSFQPITWQAPPQSFTISWPEVRAFRPFQAFSTAAQQRQVMAALYYF